MISIKNEGDRARPRGIAPEMVLAVFVAYLVYLKHGRRDMTITSIGEVLSVRSKGSRHLSGYAIDLRTRGIPTKIQESIVTQMQAMLGDDYDVVLESNHIHVEFDPEP